MCIKSEAKEDYELKTQNNRYLFENTGNGSCVGNIRRVKLLGIQHQTIAIDLKAHGMDRV